MKSVEESLQLRHQMLSSAVECFQIRLDGGSLEGKLLSDG